jgi:hypothetical protein
MANKTQKRVQWKKAFLALVKGNLVSHISGGICPESFQKKHCENFRTCESCWEDNLRKWAQQEDANQD